MNSEKTIVIAIDGTSASGKSTNARLVSKALGFTYVDTGAMYRTLAWYSGQSRIDVNDPKAVGQLCRQWKTKLMCIDGAVRLIVDNYFPEKEIRTAETSALVPHVAAVPKVRDWMKQKQRDCIQFGSLVMEGRDIGSNVFPETDYKFYIDAALRARSERREAEGVNEDLAARDKRDSQRAAAPLMVPLGAKVIDTSDQTPKESSEMILDHIRAQMRAEGKMPDRQ
ncbi:(d)CMP kinase [bacterium]|nr:(d)CMP kinase [Verrucomicrobiota bacterium]MDA7632707.1 (d)CMP kinase [bacterium]MDA7645343.1 (d)CMP kinase [bacterium]MDB4796569.1 (d)CMP kinase [bacterium]